MTKDNYDIYRNVCPRNYYNSCSMLSYVKDGRLYKITGDPKHGYTQGKLCAKGYSYCQYVYSQERLRYPHRQYPRGSGKWERISWEQAIEQVAEKTLELNHTYGSNLPLTYNKGTGNVGLIGYYAVDGMFNSIGPHTKAIGNVCLASGQDALSYDFGQAKSPDPEQMIKSKLIIIWGANPASTAIHQMKFIQKAQNSGAKLLVVDPIFTTTATKADLYIQINPGTDGLLALCLANILIDKDQYDHSFIQKHTIGFEALKNYLQSKDYSPEHVSQITGVSQEAILEIATLLAKTKPCSIWLGFGLQRNTNGGQNIRAINTLMALTGNIGLVGGGLYYLHSGQTPFPLKLLNHKGPQHPNHSSHRIVSINNFASEILELEDPPVKLLWISGRNSFSQDQNINKWKTLLQQLDLVITVDLFMTATAEQSDLVLPAASPFEEYELVVSYWHHWLALNQKTLPPYFEAKSDLEIARMFTRKLNELSPGFSNFPSELTAEDWISQEFTPEVLSLYGLESWGELKDGPRKLLNAHNPWADNLFLTDSKKFEIYSAKAKKNHLPAIPRFRWTKPNQYPLRLLSPQNLSSIHSQYQWLSSFDYNKLNMVRINQQDAQARSLTEGDSVFLFNDHGCITRKVHISDDVPPGVLAVYQGGEQPVSNLISNSFTDMGLNNTGSNSVAFYDIYVECKKRR